MQDDIAEAGVLPRDCLWEGMSQGQEEICLVERPAPRASETKDARSISILYTCRTGNEPVLQVSVAAMAEVLNVCAPLSRPQEKISSMGNCMLSS